MKFEILLSAMHQNDFSLVKKSNISSSVLIINQSDKEEYIEHGLGRMLTTSERGLSKSRNRAITSSKADIGLIADDDEIFIDNLEERIVAAYAELPQADVIVFNCSIKTDSNRSDEKVLGASLGSNIKKLSYLDTLRVASWQISFRLNAIRKSDIFFDEKLGSGTGNGAGEENKFLWDCLKKGLLIYYVPLTIATVAQEESRWFFGYDANYFYQRGKTTRYIFGLPFAFCYGVYFILRKRNIYKADSSMLLAFKHLLRGIFSKGL